MTIPTEGASRNSAGVRSSVESGIRLNTHLILLLLNLAALVWGAAKVSATVEQLKNVTTELQVEVTGLRNELGQIRSDVMLLKDHDMRQEEFMRKEHPDRAVR